MQYLKMTEWSVETCSPIISSNKCCAGVNNWLIKGRYAFRSQLSQKLSHCDVKTLPHAFNYRRKQHCWINMGSERESCGRLSFRRCLWRQQTHHYSYKAAISVTVIPNLTSSQRSCWSLMSSVMSSRVVVWILTDISEECSAIIFRVKQSKMLPVTSSTARPHLVSPDLPSSLISK